MKELSLIRADYGNLNMQSLQSWLVEKQRGMHTKEMHKQEKLTKWDKGKEMMLLFSDTLKV